MAARPYAPYGLSRLDLFRDLYLFPFSYVLYRTPAARLLERALSLVPLVLHQYDNQCTARTMYLPRGGPSEALRRTNTFSCLPTSASCLKNRPRIALGPLQFGSAASQGPHAVSHITYHVPRHRPRKKGAGIFSSSIPHDKRLAALATAFSLPFLPHVLYRSQPPTFNCQDRSHSCADRLRRV